MAKIENRGPLIQSQFRLDGAPMLDARTRRNVQCSVVRLRMDRPNHGLTDPIPRSDGYYLGLQLLDQPRQQTWLGSRAVPSTPLPSGTISIVHLELEPKVNLLCPFDLLVFSIPRSALDEVADDHGVQRIGSLASRPFTAIEDPIVKNLGCCLLPAFEHPERVSTLYLSHMLMAFNVHLAHTYGGMRLAEQWFRGGLAPWQERLAKEMISSHLDGNLSLLRIASACKLSPSHFARAFKQSVGQSPHQWLLARRIDRAKHLMLTSRMPLADIATACGFSDQSHLTRTFVYRVGETPRIWRGTNTS
jgi:AraC family transcriptional regulator